MGTKNLFTGTKTSASNFSKQASKNLHSNQPPQSAAGPMPSGPATLEQKVYGLEQRVQQLEAQVEKLLSVIEVGNYGQTVRIHAHNVELDAALDLKLKAGMHLKGNAGSDCELKAGMQLKGSAGTQCELKAGSILHIESANLVDVKGTMMRLNNGSKALAFGGDPVAGNKIVTGTSKILA